MKIANSRSESQLAFLILVQVLWVSKGPIYIHYGIPAMLGLGVRYSLSVCVGTERAEENIAKSLEQRALRHANLISLKD